MAVALCLDPHVDTVDGAAVRLERERVDLGGDRVVDQLILLDLGVLAHLGQERVELVPDEQDQLLRALLGQTLARLATGEGLHREHFLL